MSHSFQLAIVIVTFCIIGATSKALACSCVESGPPCQAYWQWQSVFVGTPLSSSVIQVDNDGHKVDQRLFRMRVDEVFQGVSSKRVDVLTGAWGGDCGYDFKIGTRYLIYGRKVTGKPWIATGICSRTRPLSEATEDLRFIRSIPNLSSGATIYGTATRFNVNLDTGTWDPTGKIAGARVTAISGDRKLEHMTGSDGSYRFENLRPGKYIVSLTLPANLSPTNDQSVEIHERGCAEINYRTVIDGRLEGRLINADGQSSGVKTVDLIALTNDVKALRRLWAITGADGRFQFKELPAGRYVLAINVDDAPDNDLPYKQTFYPLTEDRSTAEVFSLAEGQHLGGIEFRLPKPLDPREIRGVVVWPDGRPAVGSEVELKHIDSGRSAKWGIKTDKMGQFNVSGFSGVVYKLVATIPADPNWNPDSGRGVELLSSDEVELTPSGEPVKLVIKPNGNMIRRTKTIVRAPATKPKSKKRRKSNQ